MSKKYWVTCIEETLGEMGLDLTEEQIEDIAGSVEIYHENYGMSHGHDVISCGAPDTYRLEQENKTLKARITELVKDIHSYRKSVATRRGVDVSDVYLENDTVYYGRV